jgi:hypothetical protein
MEKVIAVNSQQSRGSVRTASRRRRGAATVVLGVLAALIWGVLATAAQESASGNPARERGGGQGSNVERFHTAPRTAPATCHTPTGLPCYKWAKRKARAVREHRMTLSPRGHYHLTRHTKRLIRRWFENHPRIMAREMAEDGFCQACRVEGGHVVGARASWCFFCDLYPDPRNLGRCLTYLVLHPSVCTAEGDRVHDAQQDVVRVVVVCGGGALIAYKVGGAAGAAIGSGVANCFWAHWANELWDR